MVWPGSTVVVPLDGSFGIDVVVGGLIGNDGIRGSAVVVGGLIGSDGIRGRVVADALVFGRLPSMKGGSVAPRATRVGMTFWLCVVGLAASRTTTLCADSGDLVLVACTAAVTALPTVEFEGTPRAREIAGSAVSMGT